MSARRTPNVVYLFVPLFVFVSTASLARSQEARDVLRSAKVLLDFSDVKDSRLVPSAGVALGVELAGDELAESTLRGGDGRVAVLSRGDSIACDQATNERLRELTGRQITFGARIKCAPDVWKDSPIFSKHGGHGVLAFNAYCGGDAIGVEVGTTGNRGLLQALAPRTDMRDADDCDRWRDVYCRVDGAKLELFVDGRCCDEDFMLGDLKTNDVPFIIGAQYDSDAPDAKPRAGFEGAIDFVAVWDRALSNEEIVALSGGKERADLRERTERLREESTQYWTPPNGYGVGDCMPFYVDGVFHFMYLLDKKRHGAKNGLGAHQWIQATSTDLVHWRHQPFVVPITDQNEGSICTGSVFYHDGTYYAFYANRAVEFETPDGVKHNVFGLICVATSSDGVHFDKQAPQPLFLLPEGYAASTRDPVVFQSPDDGRFYMYMTTSYRGKGCWARARSENLRDWELLEPEYSFKNGEPECPDWFQWGDRYYLIANHLNGYYLTSKNPNGPWEIPDRPNILMPGLVNVPKTAPYKDGRRIICGWTRERGFGGSAVFHELIRREDGTLGEKFVPEMIPATAENVVSERDVDASETREFILPERFRLRALLTFDYDNISLMRDVVFSYAENRAIRVAFSERAVYLNDVKLEAVDFTSGSLALDCVAKDNIVDLCVNDERTATFASRDPETRRCAVTNEACEYVAIETLEIDRLEK